tara:strand:- start:808 stop:1143 length:336 start_codon:yes stop_codon:yes gene_type:complete
MNTEKTMKQGEILFKTKIGDYFYVVTRYMGKDIEDPQVDVYHTVAYREIIDGVGDYAGTRVAGIAGEVDIESCHLDLCAIYKKRLEKGGDWEGHDRPLKSPAPEGWTHADT